MWVQSLTLGPQQQESNPGAQPLVLGPGLCPTCGPWPAGWAEKMQQKGDLGHTESRGLCLPCQSGGFLRSGASLLTWETFFLGTL